jgi:hypothetical protein
VPIPTFTSSREYNDIKLRFDGFYWRINAMADLQQLTLLNQGIAARNTWRELFPDIWPNLDGINLSNSNLAGINFSTEGKGIITTLTSAKITAC